MVRFDIYGNHYIKRQLRNHGCFIKCGIHGQTSPIPVSMRPEVYTQMMRQLDGLTPHFAFGLIN